MSYAHPRPDPRYLGRSRVLISPQRVVHLPRRPFGFQPACAHHVEPGHAGHGWREVLNRTLGVSDAWQRACATRILLDGRECRACRDCAEARYERP